MIDVDTYRQGIRDLKARIRNDPAVLARYDLDGNGEISGEEWEKALEVLREELERNPDTAAQMTIETIHESRADEEARPSLTSCSRIVVKQLVERRELLYGYETSNRYVFIDPDSGTELGGADEDHGGVAGFMSRQFLGSARPLNLGITDPTVGVWMEGVRPFSPIGFVRPPVLTVSWNRGLLGTIRRVWPLIVRRRYHICVVHQPGPTLVVDGSLLRPWTFPIKKNGRPVGTISKRWSGGARELFTDADSFLVSFDDRNLSAEERRLVIAASLAIDYDCFESDGSR